MKCNMYILTDLQSCYDRQLPNVGSIAEELVGRNHNAMKFFTSIMPNFQHHANMAYGISDGFHRSHIELADTGQGNKLLRNMCRDVLCLFIK